MEVLRDFKTWGFRITRVTGGYEALANLDAAPVDIVISEVEMPGGNGIELLDTLKERNYQLPIFMVLSSGKSLELTAEEAYERGAEAVFTKPLDSGELFSAITYALLPIHQRFLRKDYRLNLEVPIGIRFLDSGFLAKTKTLNIARGGMFVELEGRLPSVSERVEFCFEDAPHTMMGLNGAGIVRWVRSEATPFFPTGCGVEFMRLTEINVVEIVAMTEKLKPKSFIPRK